MHIKYELHKLNAKRYQQLKYRYLANLVKYTQSVIGDDLTQYSMLISLYISSRLSRALFSAWTLCGNTLTAKYLMRFSPLKNSNLPLTMMLKVLNRSESKCSYTFSSDSFSLNSLNLVASMPIQTQRLYA